MGVRHERRNLAAKRALNVRARHFKPRRSDGADCVALRGANSSFARCSPAGRSDDWDRAASGETDETYRAASGKAYPPLGTAADKARGAAGAADDTP